MTDAQIRFHQMVESKRHNQAQEALSKYATDVQSQTSRYTADTNFAGTKYSADKHAESSKYAADTSYAGTRYSADKHAEASKYASDQSAQTSKYATDVQAATQKYVSDQNVAAQKYATDVNAATQQARLALDRQIQLVRNSLEAKRLRLDQLRTQVQNENTRAQTKKIAQDMANSLEALALQARELGLKEEAAKYTNALNAARAAESKAKTSETKAKTTGQHITNVRQVYDMLKPIFDELLGAFGQRS